MSSIGEPEKEIISEPLEWPASEPIHVEPAAPAAPELEPEKVPA